MFVEQKKGGSPLETHPNVVSQLPEKIQQRGFSDLSERRVGEALIQKIRLFFILTEERISLNHLIDGHFCRLRS